MICSDREFTSTSPNSITEGNNTELCHWKLHYLNFLEPWLCAPSLPGRTLRAPIRLSICFRCCHHLCLFRITLFASNFLVHQTTYILLHGFPGVQTGRRIFLALRGTHSYKFIRFMRCCHCIIPRKTSRWILSITFHVFKLLLSRGGQPNHTLCAGGRSLLREKLLVDY